MRARALGEIHARPHVLIDGPRVVLQLAFMTDGGSTVDHAVLSELSRARGVAPPNRDASHHQLRWGTGTLRWERHSEFSTYFWDGPLPNEVGGQIVEHPFGSSFNPPGLLISAVRVEVRNAEDDRPELLKQFDPASLCCSDVKDGQAKVITDFQQNGDGLTSIIVIDNGMSVASRSALVQRLSDIETYRTLAMLGLPVAQSLSPALRRIEDGLAGITQQMKSRAKDRSNNLLDDLSDLAAELEAGAALSLYRFGASAAYYEIVQERIKSLGEASVSGYETLGTFLERRLAPAVRTCVSVEGRQANLSRKLSRATILVRSWIDLEIEQQNSAVLASMNNRANLQLRLQHTVEGLSVAAVSYYIVGLVGYLAKGFEDWGPHFKAATVTSMAVPIAICLVWFLVKSIRKHHSAGM
ncbi:DUF3422 family protein [Rhizobium leguminosarum]|nr:DUF3422 family protein [Rhizobium leguminosarum]NKK61520.1 DUF3422 family protein [Rhizobium leguminosarum bv. viciae]